MPLHVFITMQHLQLARDWDMAVELELTSLFSPFSFLRLTSARVVVVPSPSHDRDQAVLQLRRCRPRVCQLPVSAGTRVRRTAGWLQGIPSGRHGRSQVLREYLCARRHSR